MVGKKSKKGLRFPGVSQQYWRRLLSGGAIALQVDLEKGKVTTTETSGLDQLLNLDVKNMDQVIRDYVDAEDRVRVQQSLQQARKGAEEPILFNFVAPGSERKHPFEFRYEIVYVKYASTCLKGSLVKVNSTSLPRGSAS